MIRNLAGLLLLASACYVAPNAPGNAPPQYAPTHCPDNDADGYCVDVDCNDYDPRINPGAADILADGIDQNCDGAL